MTRQFVLLLALGITLTAPAAAQKTWNLWAGMGQSLADYDVTANGTAGRSVRYDGNSPALNLSSLLLGVGGDRGLTIELAGMLGRHDVSVYDSAPGNLASVMGRSGRLAVATVRIATDLPLGPAGPALHFSAGPALVYRSGSAWSGLAGRTDLGASLATAFEFTVAGVRFRAGAGALLYQARLSSPDLSFPSRFHHDLSVSLSARMVQLRGRSRSGDGPHP